MRIAPLSILAILAGLAGGAATSPEVPALVERYAGPTVDSFDLADMCEREDDAIACFIVLNDAAMSDDCRSMRRAPTDANIQRCFGWSDGEMLTLPADVAEAE